MNDLGDACDCDRCSCAAYAANFDPVTEQDEGEISSGAELFTEFADTGKDAMDRAVDETVKAMRIFASGATRNVEVDPDYHGFLSPLALHAYGEYMHRHRLQADGTLRDSDNWQKGIPNDTFVRSLVRHVHDIQLVFDGYGELARQDDRDDNVLLAHLSAALFNVQGLLHNVTLALLEDERRGEPEERVIRLNADGTPAAHDMFRTDEVMQIVGTVVGALIEATTIFPTDEVLSALDLGMKSVLAERNQEEVEGLA